MRASIEVADIFSAAGPAYRAARAGHLSLDQLKVMSAIEHCRTAVMGGHVEACTDCGHWRVAYNSCRNRHCPRCQGAAARTWLAEREADLLPVGYFHVVFTLPAEVADVALQNKAAVYGLLFQAASETMTIIAADPKHLGARIGITAVLHTWGSAMTHHPHIHMIVPGGGLSPDSSRWISSRPAFLLPVRVLGKLFRRLFLTRLMALHDAGRLGFHGSLAQLGDRRAFLRHLAPVRKKRWVVYAKPPFAGPQTVLAYLSRYTHRVAISNSRLLRFNQTGVTFRYKDYGRGGADRQQVMTLTADEFTLEHDVEVSTVSLVDLRLALPMHAHDVHPVHITSVQLGHRVHVGGVPRIGVSFRQSLHLVSRRVQHRCPCPTGHQRPCRK